MNHHDTTTPRAEELTTKHTKDTMSTEDWLLVIETWSL